MSDLFLKAVNMSISAGWLVLVVLVFRFILKKAPKWTAMLLWAIVAVRLICPLSLESTFSLVPSAETVSPEMMTNPEPAIHSGFTAIDNRVNPFLSQTFAPDPVQSANPLQIWIPILSIVWIAGILILLAYTVISYWKLARRVRTAVRFQDNIYQSELVTFPFVLGILRPRVYLPFKLKEQDRNYVIAHEYAHIRRKDYWWKPFGFLLATVYWFNPLMWIAYILFCRDIEFACDENVINAMEKSDKAAYAQALLNCSIPRRINLSCPLAFGEIGVKQRVKSVLHYRKPAFWIIISAVILCIVAAVCFLTNPVSDKDSGELYSGAEENRNAEILQEDPYFRLVDLGDYEYKYTLYDSDGTVILEEQVPGRCPTISYIDENTIVVLKGAGTGVFFCTYYDILQARLSKTYESPCAAAYGRVAYTDYRDTGNREQRVILIVEDLFEENGYYLEADLNIAWQVTPINHAEFLDRDTLLITYLPIGAEEEITTALHLPEENIQGENSAWEHEHLATDAVTPGIDHSPEQTAQAAYFAFLSGDGSLLEDAELGQAWEDFYLPNSELEYVLGDLDGDGISELLIQYVDTPEYLNAVFHYDNGQLICWAFDDVEMSSRDYPLSDGTMVHQYDFNGTSSYTIFRYLSNGEKENLASLFTRYEVIPEDSPLPVPYFEIDGIETDQITFESELAQRITNQRLDNSIWTAIHK